VIAVVDAVDAVAGAVRGTLSARRSRRIAAATAFGYVLVYLVAIQDIGISLDGQYGRLASIPSIAVVPDWTDRLFAARAPFLYEPVATVYPLAHVALFVSPGNLLVGSALGALLGLNLGAALHASARGGSCRTGFAGALGALPGFLLGFSCCAPTLILLLGTGFAATVLPAFIPVRAYLLPLALALMTATLAWTALRTRRGTPAGLTPPGRS
jgi:hypothetical protein